MRLLVGAPCVRREWIITEWFYHILHGVKVLNEFQETEVAFILLGGETDPTFTKIQEILQVVDLNVYVEYIDEPRIEDKRDWAEDRYHRMVALRNRLLGKARGIGPDYFLSVDTDVLLHPNCIKNLVESAQTFDVVGGRCYMSYHNDAPSNMIIGKLSNQRIDSRFVIPVDVVMAIKLMSPKAYGFDYQYNYRGEDLGIAEKWREAGLTIGYDGRVGNKHCMSPDDLHKFDERIGW